MDLTWDLFRFPFDDPDWKSQMLLGAVLGALGMLFPFAFIPMFGMGVRVARQTAAGQPAALPRWERWGELLLDGLRVTIVMLVYSLPVIALWLVLYGAVSVIPAFAAFQADSNPGALWSGMLATVAVSMMVGSAAMLIGLPLTYFGTVALMRAIALNALSEAFNFREVWQEGKNGFRHYVIAFALWIGVYYVGAFAASVLYYTCILACLYPFALGAAIFYHSLVAGGLYGKAYQLHHTPPAAPATP